MDRDFPAAKTFRETPVDMIAPEQQLEFDLTFADIINGVERARPVSEPAAQPRAGDGAVVPVLPDHDREGDA